MKVFFENGVSAYSGKYLEIVYMTVLNNRLCLARKYNYPELGTVHTDMREIAQNLNKLYLGVDALYLADLKAYARMNTKENLPKAKKQLHTMPSAKALFIRIMWAWFAEDPEHVNLKTVTMDEIMTLESPCRSVKLSVEAGYLAKVRKYADLTHPISS